ncbi:MAG TPA: hypothetical protein VKA27_10745 [Sunxiuqinia sp.]|nr:hypothetical protein [Sunxiuqinia sp.]
MKKQILDFLKSYQIDLPKILTSDKESGKLYMIDPNDIRQDKYLLNYEVVQGVDEIDIFLDSGSKIQDNSIFENFSAGLIELINSNSDTKVHKVKLKPNWFGWHENNADVHFGIKNEIFRFEGRISFKI